MLVSSMGMGMAPELHPDGWGGQEKVSNEYPYYASLLLFYDVCSKISLGLADAGVPHGVGFGPRTPPRCLEEPGKSLK